MEVLEAIRSRRTIFRFQSKLVSREVLDRIFGYGLKYSDRFQHTHLGEIGNN